MTKMTEKWSWMGEECDRLSANTIEELEEKVSRFKTLVSQEKNENK
jgi:hypothetical protein